MKHVRNRSNRRKAFVEKAKQNKDLLKVDLNEDLVKKTVDKVGMNGLSNIVNGNDGVDITARQLNNKISRADVSNVRNMLTEKSNVFDADNPLLKKKFFYPFRGVWFFDIVFNRKLKQNPDNQQVLLQVGVFINGNTGFARTYEIADKTAGTIRGIYEQFIDDCRKLNVNGTIIKYPCKKIISDNEPGVPASLPGIEIVKITQTGTNHRLLSRINSFASALRKYNNNHYPNRQYITDETLTAFTDLWNKKTMPFVACTRNEMMCDVGLEEAYISACMMENLDIKKTVDEVFNVDDLVRIRETNEEHRDNPQVYGKEKRETYKVISTADGKLQLQNTTDPNDIRTVGTDLVTRQVVSNRENLDTYLARNNLVLPPHIPDEPDIQAPQHVPLNRTPQQQETNRSIAEAHRNTTTKRRARELLALQEGERNMNYKPSKVDLGNIHNLSQAELTDIARKYVEQEMQDNFNLGFITNWKPEEQYARMEEFIRTIPPQFHEQFFGDTVFYQNKKNKDVSLKTRVKLGYNLRKLLEDPEFLKVYDTPHSADHKNIIANILGQFIKNKRGPKQK